MQPLRNLISPDAPSFQDGRIAWWWVCWLLVRPAPAFVRDWRKWLLRRCNAKRARGTRVYNSGTISLPGRLAIGECSTAGLFAEIYRLGKVASEDKGVVSQHACLCAGTHEISSSRQAIGLKTFSEAGAANSDRSSVHETQGPKTSASQ